MDKIQQKDYCELKYDRVWFNRTNSQTLAAAPKQTIYLSQSRNASSLETVIYFFRGCEALLQN